jgi:aminoglycoside phosphotransferase (APT) family kinase protein
MSTMTMDDLDVVSLEKFLSNRGLSDASIESFVSIGGGTQNVMARICSGGREFVVRRGPRHLRPGSNTVILRETRVLKALAGTAVPAPRLIDVCEDPDVLGGAVFYLMEPLRGFNVGTELPLALRCSPYYVRRLAFSVIDALAALGAVDPSAVGLADYGRPDGFLERQADRWLKEVDSYAQFDRYPGADLPGLRSIADWLRAKQPATWTPGLMHGDFHIANVMFDRTSLEVEAIVDWEMSTIGDPLLDLGWLLATWQLPDARGIFDGPLMSVPGLPEPAELIERYAARSTRDLAGLDWYVVLACFKLGILLEGTHARAHAGQADPQTGQDLHIVATSLFRRANALIEAL